MKAMSDDTAPCNISTLVNYYMDTGFSDINNYSITLVNNPLLRQGETNTVEFVLVSDNDLLSEMLKCPVIWYTVQQLEPDNPTPFCNFAIDLISINLISSVIKLDSTSDRRTDVEISRSVCSLLWY